MSRINAMPNVLRLLAFDEQPQPVSAAIVDGIRQQIDTLNALGAGGREDPVVARTLAAISAVQAIPGQLLGDPAVLGPVARYLGRSHYAPGADRAELLAAVGGAERSR